SAKDWKCAGSRRRPKIRQSLSSHRGSSGIRVSLNVKFQGAVAAIIGVLEDAKRSGHVHAKKLAFLVGFHVLDMTNAVSVLEHGGDALVCIFLVARRQRIAKV